MELQPYGPVEEAIQKSIIPITKTSKTKYFFWGVISGVAISAAAVAVFCHFKRQKNKTNERDLISNCNPNCT